MTQLYGARWVKRGSRIYSFSRCLYCGTGWGTGCEETTCLACWTPQCMGNGLRNGTCGLCLWGLLPGWSGTNRPCGYKGCTERAVAFAPRVRAACRVHLERATICRGKSRTLAAYIADRLANREREMVFVEVPSSLPVAGYLEIR